MTSTDRRPKSMRAAILVEQRKPLRVEEVELPERLEVGQVLVRVACSGICGSQLGEIDGVKGEDRYLPHLLGHEGAGHVVEIGPGVRTVNPGDTVVLHWRTGSGIDSAPPTYRWQGRPLNSGWVTSFNEYAVVSENRLTVIPPEIDLDVAALLGCAVTTGFGIVNNNARLRIGESIVVLGAGGVGLSVVQAARMVSAQPIVAVDRYEGRLELARELGASHTLQAGEIDLREELRRILGPPGADVFVDNTGLTEMIELGYETIHNRGRLVLVGVPPKGKNASIYTLPIHMGKTLVGSHGGDAMPEEDIPRYIRLIQSGKLPLANLITNTFSLDEINDAIEQMRSGVVAGRCMIRMQT